MSKMVDIDCAHFIWEAHNIWPFVAFGLVPRTCSPQDSILCVIMSQYHLLMPPSHLNGSVSVCTHVCGLRNPKPDLRQRSFPFFSFMLGCLHVSDSDLRHPICDSDFFGLGAKKSDDK